MSLDQKNYESPKTTLIFAALDQGPRPVKVVNGFPDFRENLEQLWKLS